jgi:Phage endonuclease I
MEYSQPAKLRKYTPDFILANGIVIETKGRFITQDRQKHLAIKECHPDLDLRFVFSNPHQTISKQSKTTYAKWCDTKGFKWAKGDVPMEWINEPPTAKRLAATKRALKWEPK